MGKCVGEEGEPCVSRFVIIVIVKVHVVKLMVNFTPSSVKSPWTR